MSITPDKCVNCKLCQDSCPFDAIDKPTEELKSSEKEYNKKRFTIFTLLIPVWIFVGGFTMSLANNFLAKAHPDVYLAELMIKHPELKNDKDNIDIQTFLSSEKTIDQLLEEVTVIKRKYYIGSWIFGGFLGLVIGIMLSNQFVVRKQEDYLPNRTNCFSCGRCMNNCPIKNSQKGKLNKNKLQTNSHSGDSKDINE